MHTFPCKYTHSLFSLLSLTVVGDIIVVIFHALVPINTNFSLWYLRSTSMFAQTTSHNIIIVNDQMLIIIFYSPYESNMACSLRTLFPISLLGPTIQIIEVALVSSVAVIISSEKFALGSGTYIKWVRTDSTWSSSWYCIPAISQVMQPFPRQE